MRNFTLDIHGEVHLCNLDTMQHGTDGPKKHAEWAPQNWHHVLFIDECRICLQPDNRWLHVWRQPGQANRLLNSVHRVQQGGGSLMFWGGIMWDRRTPLVKRLYDT